MTWRHRRHRPPPRGSSQSQPAPTASATEAAPTPTTAGTTASAGTPPVDTPSRELVALSPTETESYVTSGCGVPGVNVYGHEDSTLRQDAPPAMVAHDAVMVRREDASFNHRVEVERKERTARGSRAVSNSTIMTILQKEHDHIHPIAREPSTGSNGAQVIRRGRRSSAGTRPFPTPPLRQPREPWRKPYQ